MLLSSKLKQYDRFGMLNHLLNFPEMCARALDWNVETLRGNVTVVGMGGSGVVGDLLCDLGFRVRVCKQHVLSGEGVVIAISYSGNTYETLACVQQALRQGMRVIGISSGGRLKQLCKQHKLQWIQIPAGLPPRAALPYLLFAALKLLGKGKRGCLEALSVLKAMREEFRPNKSNDAMRFALQLKSSMPCIYAPFSLKGVAERFKSQLNENSKVFAKVEVLPELCHNEVVSLPSIPAICSFVLLREVKEDELMRACFEFLRHELRGKRVLELKGRGRSRLAQVLSLVYLTDWISFYLAILQRMDPTPTPAIERFKQVLWK